ncbi:helix-turn-helix domain-containing protein [Aquimarina algiphila]|uniref:helix-turn-helix domain-containing protein n=1 Tax=Aquimarina algiphila TaxID=2047982 RepID=UPI00249179B8|nr:helix-turn-helix transcriptional regulator [Aquimarina algiphila]
MDGVLFSDKRIQILLTSEEYLSLFFSILMIGLILYKIYKYEKSRTEFNLSDIKAKTKWLKQALIIGILTCISWIFVIKDNIARFEEDLSTYYPLWIIISILVYWIVYKGIIETRILNQRFDIRNNTIKSIPNIKKPLPINDDLFLEIEHTIINKKLFLNPNLSLELIAEKFDISVSHLSRVINKNSSQSFTDFINRLRIDESKKMLINPDYKNYTIEAIGYESGFNSKSNFYTAFKKETQKTPSAYRSGK